MAGNKNNVVRTNRNNCVNLSLNPIRCIVETLMVSAGPQFEITEPFQSIPVFPCISKCATDRNAPKRFCLSRNCLFGNGVRCIVAIVHITYRSVDLTEIIVVQNLITHSIQESVNI